MSEKKNASLSCGQLLKQARLAKLPSLSEADVAKKLYLNEQIIIDIENDDYQHIPNLTYARGYVRNYAQYVGAPVEIVLAAFSELEWQGKKQADFEAFIPAEDKPMLYGGQVHQPIRSLYVGTKNMGSRFFTKIFALILILIILAAGAVWWWHQHSVAPIAQAVVAAPIENAIPTASSAKTNNASPDTSATSATTSPAPAASSTTLPYVPAKHFHHAEHTHSDTEGDA